MAAERRKVLVVDDEETVRSSLNLLLGKHFETRTVASGEEALKEERDFHPDVILLDLMMPKMDGLETLKKLREAGCSASIVMLTAANTVRSAVDAMKLGAQEYLNKPFNVEQLTKILLTDFQVSGAPQVQTPEPSVRPEAPEADSGKLVGQSDVMKELFEKLGRVATKDTTVLITGESGTGKELLARRIHELSKRARAPFIAINCAAIPEALIESELFGHEKGAFTHAMERRIGHFERADGGTLFLDEIGELSLAVQVKMLRFLQEQEFFRVGSSKSQRVDVRVIAATNKNLEESIQEGAFREDLFYRINVINLALPPLRDRFEDIRPLVKYFGEKYREIYDGRVLEFDDDALGTLVEYAWPGNVRELENVIESLMALSSGSSITKDDLPKKLRMDSKIASLRGDVFSGEMNFEEAERRFEREMISKALRKTNNVQTRAADLLGISRRILKYKMDKLGLTDELKLGADSAEHPEEVPEPSEAASEIEAAPE